MFWMLPMLATAAVGAVSGGIKAAQEKRQEDAQRKMRAAEQRNAPWTGRQSFTEVKPATDMGANIMSGGIGGAQSGAQLADWGASGGWDKLLGKSTTGVADSVMDGVQQSSPMLGGQMPQANAGPSLMGGGAANFWDKMNSKRSPFLGQG